MTEVIHSVNPWWYEAFPLKLNPSEKRGHPRGSKTMLIIVAYDVTKPKRLKKIADCCKDYGIRVQYSVFECRVSPSQYQKLWKRLQSIADPDEDRILIYPIHGAQEQQIKTIGHITHNEAVVAYVF